MRLVYKDTGKAVEVGDIVDLGRGEMVSVRYFREPHKAASSGHVSVTTVNSDRSAEYYVGVIGAVWVDREDRGES